MAYSSALIYFGLLTLVMLFVEIMFTYATQGFGYGFSSNRDPETKFSQLGLRIKRAYQNQIESSAYVIPVLVAAIVLGLESSSGEIAALLLVLGRAIFAVLYYSGVPFARLFGFGMATFSTLFIAYLLLMSGLI